MDKPYRMMKLTVIVEKDVHISCVESAVEQFAELGRVTSVDATHYIDTSPRFGDMPIGDKK